MEKHSIEKEVRIIIEKEFGKKDIVSNLDFMNGINGWDFDSLDFVRMIVLVEKYFDIIIDFDEEFQTLNELVEIVHKKLRKEDK